MDSLLVVVAGVGLREFATVLLENFGDLFEPVIIKTAAPPISRIATTAIKIK